MIQLRQLLWSPTILVVKAESEIKGEKRPSRWFGSMFMFMPPKIKEMRGPKLLTRRKIGIMKLIAFVHPLVDSESSEPGIWDT